MDFNALFAQFGPSFGAFAPCALLGWWVIRNQAKTIEAKDLRIASLTDALFKLAQSGERTAQTVLGIAPPAGS